MLESGALISAVLRVVHPELYAAGRDTLLLAATNPIIAAILEHWPTVFHGVQVVSNRETPYHRDVSGCPQWLDMLISLGTHQRTTLVARNLGMQIAYEPGTLVLLNGLLVHHGVAPSVPDRLCYAWWMSEALYSNHGGCPVGWPSRRMYPDDFPW